MEILENINNIGDKLKNINLDFSKMQENFLESKIGQIANSALDVGLKKILPDFLEDEVIEIKDTLLSEGLTEGVNKAIESAIDLGKTAMGIFTGEFESIEQAKDALEKGGMLEGISDGLDYVLEKLENSNIISNNISTLIKSGKELIINNIDSNVDIEFNDEIESLNKINNYIEKWEKSYSDKDIEGLNKQYKNIQKEMKKIMPLEKILNNVKKIENINELINNSKDFNFDSVYLDLAENI